jgi:hypothetical protein
MPEDDVERAARKGAQAEVLSYRRQAGGPHPPVTPLGAPQQGRQT